MEDIITLVAMGVGVVSLLRVFKEYFESKKKIDTINDKYIQFQIDNQKNIKKFDELTEKDVVSILENSNSIIIMDEDDDEKSMKLQLMVEVSLMSKVNTSKSTAPLAGASGGTLAMLISTSLPEGNFLKEFLLYSAPTISVAIGALVAWVQIKIANYAIDREAKILYEDLKSRLKQMLESSETSPQHKEELRKKLEELEIQEYERVKERLSHLKYINYSHIRD